MSYRLEFISVGKIFNITSCYIAQKNHWVFLFICQIFSNDNYMVLNFLSYYTFLQLIQQVAYFPSEILQLLISSSKLLTVLLSKTRTSLHLKCSITFKTIWHSLKWLLSKWLHNIARTNTKVSMLQKTCYIKLSKDSIHLRNVLDKHFYMSVLYIL